MKTEPIKVWLKESGHDRHWLAKQCAVSKSTVDGWMAGRGIPRPSQTIIAGLMYADKPIAPRFTMDQYSRIQQQAAKEGLAVDAWIEKIILKSILAITVTFAAFHLTRSPSDWSQMALVKSGKAAWSLIGRALA